MKGLFITLFVLLSLSASAQVMFRNDFVLGKHSKLRNKGLTFITINLDRYQNLNMLVNGRGGRSMVIDVQALRGRKKNYSYTEIAEKVYTPGPVYKPNQEPVPMFLLMEPPRLSKPEFHHISQTGRLTLPRLQSYRVQ